jgi:MoaA/NifB/PqqE/SkfB family radical SAM enzyme
MTTTEPDHRPHWQQVRDSMKLPQGATCDQCFAFEYCAGIGCTWSGRTECDYFPNRFKKKDTKL